MHYLISKDNLKVLLGKLKGSCDEFIAPKRFLLDDIIFTDVKKDGDYLLHYDGNAIASPRIILFPHTEPIYEYESAKELKVKPIVDKKKRIFFGVRPCDMKAINLMGRFFSESTPDPYYLEKLNRSVFLVLACTKPCLDESFCSEMDSGPIAEGGFDMQFMPLDGRYLAWAGSAKGHSIVAKYKKLFKLSSPKGVKEKKVMAKRFKSTCPPLNFKKLAKLMADDKVDPKIWEDIGIRCVICSGCISLCPTCSCFSTVDRIRDDKGERLRYWDGCPYAGFSRLAGGANPIPLHRDHIRRFFEHKLNVDFYNYGRPSCVGCGRCIKTCPGNISIKKFIEKVLESPSPISSPHRGED